MGDSITYAGEYINLIESAWRMQFPNDSIEILNLGLPSETVSGLSEEGHAGGAFPRPYLHERLSRVLDQSAPKVVVACYGMNDGIYHPLNEERFAAYKTGIKKLIAETKQRGIKLILMTPAFFDSLPMRARLLPSGLANYPQPYVDYDDVLEAYSDWLLTLRSDGLAVIDIHRAMKRSVLEQRESNPEFTFAKDGVHPNADGHRVIADAIATEWGLDIKVLKESQINKWPEVLTLVSRRQSVLKHAWLTATKHMRPGIERGLSLKEATEQASEIERSISELLENN